MIVGTKAQTNAGACNRHDGMAVKEESTAARDESTRQLGTRAHGIGVSNLAADDEEGSHGHGDLQQRGRQTGKGEARMAQRGTKSRPRGKHKPKHEGQVKLSRWADPNAMMA